jgi:hypothetical protein
LLPFTSCSGGVESGILAPSGRKPDICIVTTQNPFFLFFHFLEFLKFVKLFSYSR